ncbi:MAG TPA: hypothetical protein ENN43_06350 [bacterium]|nr:hypothetical protein [bacterium]
MFCPACRYEYEEGIIECPDCGEKLIEKLPGEEDEYDYEAETAELCEVEDEIEAGAIRAMLTDTGIYSFLRTNFLPSTRMALFALKQRKMGTIIVNKEDLEKAKEVVEDFKKSRGF